MALTPGARDPSWGHNARGPAGGMLQARTFQGPGRRGDIRQQGTDSGGSRSCQAHSQPHLLPRLMIPKPADHTPMLTWLLTSTGL